jgi:hypothetical protein
MPRKTRASSTHFSTIQLKNFRCYKDSGPIPFRPLTVILGPNNVGKSTILNSILLLKQTLSIDTPREAIITSGPLVDLGGFSDILYRGASRADRTFTLELEASFSGQNTPFTSFRDDPKPPTKDRGSVGLSLAFGYSPAANQILVREVEFRRDGATELKFKGHGSRISLLNKDGSERSDLDVHLLNSLPIIHGTTGKKQVPGDAQSTELTRLAGLCISHTWGWTDFHRSIGWVAPLRSAIPRYATAGSTSPGGPMATPAGLMQELKSRRRLRPTGKQLIQLVEGWAKNQLGVLRGLDLKSIDDAGTVFALFVDERAGFRGINIASMGEGVSQLIPILSAVLGSRDGACILVEQPELHLHPDLQARVADLFVDQVVHNRKQIILETHSEHLLLRVRRRVAEGAIDPSQVAVLYVDRPGRESRVRMLPIDADGHISDWPGGFFEEGIEEAYRIASAKGTGA